MKYFLPIILIFLILAQSAGKLVLLSYYLLNKETIALNYCENKSKPKLHCNGKCHLKKQLKEQEKKEGSSKSLSKSADESQFCTEYDNTILPRFIYKSNPLNCPYLNGELNNAPLSIFHPPKV